MSDLLLRWSVRVEDGAVDDIRRAMRFYRSQAPGLGRAFLHELAVQIRRIRHFPRGYQKIDATRRRATLHRYPFVIVYRLNEGCIEIIGVFDCRADPICLKVRQ